MENNPTNNLMAEDNSPLDLNLNESSVIPADITPSASPDHSLAGFWRDKEIRMWIYIFVGVLVVFLGIFLFMNKQTTEVKEKLASVETATPETGRAVPEYFTASLFNNPSNDESPNGSTSDPVGTDSPDSDLPEDPLAGFNLDELGLGEDSTGTTTTTDSTVVTPSIDTATTNDNDLNSIFDDLAATTVDPVNSADDLLGSATTNSEFGLGTNTSSEVMMSGELEGDTGPGLLVALIPSMLYGLLRKKQ
jgi:hypothetical protein